MPEGAPREILYNLISDAACAVVLSRENLQCRWRCFHQVSKGYYWNIIEKQKEIIASYFPTSRAVIRELLGKAGIGASDVRWILPTGVSKSSWDILTNIASLDSNRIYRALANFGHTIATDNSASRILVRIEEGSRRRSVAAFHLRVRFHLVRSHPRESMSEHIVLTGATGAIGLPLAACLLSRPSVERLTAIVRSSSDAAALPAILKSLNPAADITRLVVALGDVTHAGMGLTKRIDGPPISSVIHAAAFTKFRDSGSQWEQVNVTGTREVLRWRETNCPSAPV